MKKLIAFLIIGIWIYWINIGFEDKDYPIIITLPEIDTIELVEIESQEVYAGRTDTAIALYDSIDIHLLK